MNYPEYTTNWCQELPAIGVQCPNTPCSGFVEGNNFKSKSQEQMYSVKCEKCLYKWIKSKFDDLGGAKPQNKPQDTASQIILEEVQAGFKELNERLDDLGKFLSKN